MQYKYKRKEILTDEARKILKEHHPEAFQVINTTIKVKGKQSDFTKNFSMSFQFYKYLLDKIGPTYIGYWYILTSSLNYENIVNFQFLADAGVKEGMIKLCKRKFIQEGLVKKHGSYFYANPEYVQKGEAINPILLEIFKEGK